MEQYKFKSDILSEIRKSSDRIKELNSARLATEPLSFGVKYLDEITGGGISPEDFILVSARTGTGKTELAKIIAMENRHKRVHFFALEAAKNEIERRMKYSLVANVVFGPMRDHFKGEHFNYLDWMHGRFNHILGPFEKELDEITAAAFGNLKTYYPGDEALTEENLNKVLISIENETDLIIFDHIHYFDFQDENENRAMKKTVKTLKRFSEQSGKPVILLAHLRKADKRFPTVVPSIDDIHGSSDIGKQCTTAIMLSSANMELAPYHYATHIALAKFRYDMSRTRFVSVCGYDIKKNAYDEKYYLGKVSFDETKLETVSLPHWAKSGKELPQEPAQVSPVKPVSHFQKSFPHV